MLQHDPRDDTEAISQCFKSVRTTTGQFRAAWADSAESSELRFVAACDVVDRRRPQFELALVAHEGVWDYKSV